MQPVPQPIRRMETEWLKSELSNFYLYSGINLTRQISADYPARETSAVPKFGIDDGFHGNHKKDVIIDGRYSIDVR